MKYSLILSISMLLISSHGLAATGGCITYEADGVTCRLSAGASAILPAVAWNLSTGALSGGVEAVALGACYGLTYRPSRWYASGASYCFSTRLGTSEPNQIMPGALMLHVADYGAVGFGVRGTQQAVGGLRWEWWAFFAPRIPIP